MIILGTALGKTLFFWMRENAIEIALRGPSETQTWADTFSLEDAQLFFTRGALACTEQIRQRDRARQSAAAAVSTP